LNLVIPGASETREPGIPKLLDRDSGFTRSLSSGAHSRDPLACPGMTRKDKPCAMTSPELTALNRDYVASVQNSDVKRFDEILAEDFYCSNPDKSLVDRAAFPQADRHTLTISNLEAHDVKIRLMGDFAIIHARTRYTTADGKSGIRVLHRRLARQNGRWLAVSAHRFAVTRNRHSGARVKLASPESRCRINFEIPGSFRGACHRAGQRPGPLAHARNDAKHQT